MNENSSTDNKVLSNKLKDYFNDNIKLSLKTENKLFIVTKNDIFYEIDIYDENIHLFISNNDNTLIERTIVEELCHKQINDLNFGYNHYIARTASNKVYSWGNNYLGQLGNSREDNDLNVYNKPELNALLSGLEINAIECGWHHSLALTKNSEVYAWGWNRFGQIGNGCYDNQLTPIKVEGLRNQRVIMISCGFYHSMALTESGRVFSWGDNEYGQLGFVYKESSNVPQMIELNVSVIKVSCGTNHTLLLSKDGNIYAFGDNHCGQIGNGNIDVRRKPFKLNHKKRFNEIRSHWSKNISIALSVDNIYYVWGDCRENHILTPIEAGFKSFNETFFHNFESDLEIREKFNNFSDMFFRNGYFNRFFNKIEKSGEGSYGTVFRVMHKTDQSITAIKRISFKKELKNDIFREIHNFAVVDDLLEEFVVTHISAWFENSISDDKIDFYLDMEFCDKTLNEIIDEIESDLNMKTNETLTPIGYYIASQLFIELLECVKHLHKHNIIHRDLNPYNIMLKRRKNSKKVIKIVDFGLIAIHSFEERLHSGDVGSVKYMAPEVDSKIYDTKADIYSLGVILRNLFDLYYDK
jgi:alpha-tubulin suppressor-like RCC1 family protein